MDKIIDRKQYVDISLFIIIIIGTVIISYKNPDKLINMLYISIFTLIVRYFTRTIEI